MTPCRFSDLATALLSHARRSYETDPKLNDIKKSRGYTYTDKITITPEKLPNYDQKIKIFFEEHLHTDEEIRCAVSTVFACYCTISFNATRYHSAGAACSDAITTIRILVFGGSKAQIPASVSSQIPSRKARLGFTVSEARGLSQQLNM